MSDYFMAEDISRVGKQPGAGIFTWTSETPDTQQRAADAISALIQKGWMIGSHTTVVDSIYIVHTVILVKYP